MKTYQLAVAAMCLVVAVGQRAPAQSGALTAGAAKVDISPRPSALGPSDVLRDPLFVRAMIIGNGTTCAVMVGSDLIGLSEQVAQSAIARASKATGCPAENFVVSATHTHSSGVGSLRSSQPDGQMVEDAIVKAITDAKTGMRPAKIGYGTTEVNLNTNRDLFENGRWTQGPNPQGVSDKTLAIIEVLDANDLPIGVYLNYAMHPTNFYMSGVVSADFAGEASRYIERRYGPSTVAIFAQGASGDQNPALIRPQNKLSRVRTGVPDAVDMRLTAPRPWGKSSEDADLMRRRFAALASPVPDEQRATYQATIAEVGEVVTATGVILGENAINLMRYQIPSLTTKGVIRGASTTVQCPGRDRQDGANSVREGALPPYVDGQPVNLRVGMLRIGDIYISTVNGEVYSEIGLRLKREAPVSKLMMTTLANGNANSGYIYSNKASAYLTFQVIGSRLKAGCAEDKIVKASLSLINEVGK